MRANRYSHIAVIGTSLFGSKNCNKWICRFIIFFITCFMSFLYVPTPNAKLITISNSEDEKVVFDDRNNTYWYWDLSAFTGLSYPQQLSKINDINNDEYFGMSSWNIATLSDMLRSVILFNR